MTSRARVDVEEIRPFTIRPPVDAVQPQVIVEATSEAVETFSAPQTRKLGRALVYLSESVVRLTPTTRHLQAALSEAASGARTLSVDDQAVFIHFCQLVTKFDDCLGAVDLAVLDIYQPDLVNGLAELSHLDNMFFEQEAPGLLREFGVEPSHMSSNYGHLLPCYMSGEYLSDADLALRSGLVGEAWLNWRYHSPADLPVPGFELKGDLSPSADKVAWLAQICDGLVAARELLNRCCPRQLGNGDLRSRETAEPEGAYGDHICKTFLGRRSSAGLMSTDLLLGSKQRTLTWPIAYARYPLPSRPGE